MKKIFFVLLLVSLLSIPLGKDVFASETNPENLVQPGQTKIINQDLNIDTSEELQNIKVMFCNSPDNQKQTKDLTLYMRPGQRKEICIAFFNKGDHPIGLLFGFSNGIINQDGTPICEEDMTNKNVFSKAILHNSATGIIVPANGNIVKKFEYMADKSLSGNILGCMAYKLDKQEEIEPGKMFLMVIRKVGYIHINITGSVYNFGRRDTIKDKYISSKDILLKVIIALLVVLLVITLSQKDKKRTDKKK